MALMEEYIPGRTENLHDYLIPTVGDMPPIKTYLIEDAEPDGPFGAKGVGEPALIATAPAILSRHPPRHRRAHHPRARPAAPAVGGDAGEGGAREDPSQPSPLSPWGEGQGLRGGTATPWRMAPPPPEPAAHAGSRRGDEGHLEEAARP